jgi:putative cardiolipin synthase
LRVRPAVTKLVASIGAALGALALAGCAALPAGARLPVETAAPPAAHGPLAAVASAVQTRLEPGETAHWLLDRNGSALEARLALTDQAAATLDVQYFIWQRDATGNLLGQRLLAAADRGVRVRLLLDDFGVSSEAGEIIKLDAHERIDVRVFNPWATRGNRILKVLEFLRRAGVLNHRMHNKTYIADGRFAIVGGRNIGDRYFGVYEPFVQNDLDVLMAGALVDDVIDSFDVYWNSADTFAVGRLGDPVANEPLPRTRNDIEAVVDESAWRLASFPLQPADWSAYNAELAASFAPGESVLVYDSPHIRAESRPRLYDDFKQLVASAQSEVLISSPYFIPDREFRDLLAGLVRRGVRVALVTNSLATNNHVIAHTGYRRWRRQVLAAGVELYELRADAEALAEYVSKPVVADALGLHTKAVVVDDRRSFIGSPNIDPRSMVLNTEIGVIADSPELARRLGELVRRDMAPENSWRVRLDEDGWLSWSSGDTTLERQPAKGFRQRLIEFLLNLLPLKKQA